MGLQEESRQKGDAVRPGEQWFCYWKTSAALWEGRLQEFPLHEIIFIPLYWGFHAEPDGSWDFGKYHPERDLVRLIKLLTQHGRKFCWLLPLTPAPFLPNGGVPIQAARTLSVSSRGMHLASLDQDQVLHKMYSFYEPKVFQTYASFLNAFGKILAEANCKSAVWGAEFYYSDEGATKSFLSDFSLAFEQGFSRYLKKNHPEGIEIDKTLIEQKAKNLFEQEVGQLFQSVASEALAPFWSGTQSITVFGAGPRETIERALNAGKSQTHYFQNIFDSYVTHRWFSTCLLMPGEKKELLRKCLTEHFSDEEIQHRYHYLADSHELSGDFRPFVLIDVIENLQPKVFEENGLKSHLSEYYQWTYYLNERLNFTTEWIDAAHERVKFFHAQGMDRTVFAQMLKLFLMGQRVVFDSAGLIEDLDKRLQIFFLENNLKVQTVNFMTSVQLCELGEGKLVIFDGEKLKQAEGKKKFWGHLFKFLGMNHPKVEMEKDVFSLWRIRATSPHELNYLDVRRVNFYNPTSYKKSVMIHTQKKFAFMKVIDPSHANAKTTSEGVEVELLPNGNIALDFGHYEERS